MAEREKIEDEMRDGVAIRDEVRDITVIKKNMAGYDMIEKAMGQSQPVVYWNLRMMIITL